MKTLCIYFISIFSFLSLIPAHVSNEKTFTLKVKFINIKKNDKPVYMALYRSKEDFNKRKTYKRYIVWPLQQSALKIDKLPAGNYAILCFQDINANHRLDFNGYMPVEPCGASNNKILMGPPTWEDAVFELNHNLSLKIKLF